MRAAIANVCVGNMDAHGKNYALLTTDAGTQRAPFYDVVCTEAYPALEVELSITIGSTRRPSQLTPADLQRFAREVNVTPALAMSEAREVALHLKARIPRIIADVTRDVGTHPIVKTMQAVLAQRSAGIERLVSES